MPKKRSNWVCTNCGKKTTMKMSICPGCKEYDTFINETTIERNEPKDIRTARAIGVSQSHVQKLSEVNYQEQQRETTRIAEFDRVLGGGLVPGSLVLIGGEPGAGKCVTGDTFVLTKNGYKRIDKIIPKGLPTETFIPFEIELMGLHNKIVKTTHCYITDKTKTKKLMTSKGFEIEGTFEHPLMTIDKNGKYIWKRLDELKQGDYIAISRNNNETFGCNNVLPKLEITKSTSQNDFTQIDLDVKTSYIFGLLVGDGTLSDRSAISLTSNDSLLKEKFISWLNKIGLNPHTQGKYGIRISSVGLWDWLKFIGMPMCTAIDKFVPQFIFETEKQNISAFLRGLFDADGSSLKRRGEIEFSTISKDLAKQVQLLLLQFGIVCRVRQKVDKNNNASYLLWITGKDAKSFYDHIGFGLERKQERKKFLSDKNNTNWDVIPYIPNTLNVSELSNYERKQFKRYMQNKRRISYDMAKRYRDRFSEINNYVNDNYIWDIVEDVFDSNENVCYDFTIPDGHAFIANGIVSHNTTLLLNTLYNLSFNNTVLYVSGEESEAQIKMRAERMNINSDNIYVVFEKNIEQVLERHIPETKPDYLVIDSINTFSSTQISGGPGSVSQIKYVTDLLQQIAKSTGLTIFVIGQVIKSGDIAGPQTLEHAVDTVLYLEGDKDNLYRILRSVKNRFGDVNEVGVFEMTGVGLVEVPNPSAAFLNERALSAPGSAITVTMEGQRPLLVEIQSLCNRTTASNPMRRSDGFSRDRLFMVSSVIDRQIDAVQLDIADIILDVVGGMKLNERANDLAAAASIISSFADVSIPAEYVFIGEIVPVGQIRSVPNIEMRIKEAASMGFTRIVTPPMKKKMKLPKGVQLVECEYLHEIIDKVFP